MMSTYEQEQRKDLYVNIFGLLLGIGLAVGGIFGIVSGYNAAVDYSDSTDIRNVDAVIESVSTSDEENDDAAQTLNMRTYRLKITYTVEGKSCRGRYELYASGDNHERLRAYDQLGKGDVIQVEVYRSKNGTYKLTPDLNPIDFLIYCGVIPVGLVVTAAMVYDIYSKRPGAPQKEPDKKQKRKRN